MNLYTIFKKAITVFLKHTQMALLVLKASIGDSKNKFSKKTASTWDITGDHLPIQTDALLYKKTWQVLSEGYLNSFLLMQQLVFGWFS